ncbi:MAG: 50S ribosomal protein L6, partial [Spirochaetaceae bacterium]|nr:50S ribosomal protein L6 [Spirochaetaceae bacterium]
MSRIGMKPVQLPQGVKATVKDGAVTVEGPKGKLSQTFVSDVTIAVKDGTVVVERKDDSKQSRAYHGLYRNLVNNMVVGVSAGFRKALVITGVGYRAEIKDKVLLLSLGYSNDFGVAIPEGLAVAIEANGQRVVVTGHDRALLGKFASEVRSLRLPEPYKGKGI